MAAGRKKNNQIGNTDCNDWIGDVNIFPLKYSTNMDKYKYLVKTDCLACLGVFKEIIKKIDGVKEAELDLEDGKVIIEYEGRFTREALAKIIEEKTGYKIQPVDS